MKLIGLIKKQALVFAAVLVLVLVTVNTIIIYYNDWVLKKTTKIREESERAKYLTSQLWNQSVRNVDIGLRGFALTKDEGLLSPYNDGKRDFPIILKELRQISAKQGFDNTLALDSVETAINNFIGSCAQMVEMVRNDSMEQFTASLKSDPGKAAWLVFSRNSQIIDNFENKLNEQAIVEYEKANKSTLFVQTILIILGFPTLIFMIVRILRDKKARINLFLKLEKNNRDYLFNPGTSLEITNEDQVIDNSIMNFKKATEFITEISSGNFNVNWEGITKDNESLNTSNLAGELVNMREKMKKIKADDERRAWVSDGLAKFSEVIREHQHNAEALSFQVLVFIIKYLNAQQGGLFILRENEEGKKYLELSACYAFGRKKHIKRNIEIGEGLVGQTYLEKESVILTNIPEGYGKISSGLGDAKPKCLLIVPMKYNDNVEALIEIAGFKKFEQYQVEFLEKIGEITASTLGAVKNTEKVQHLLEQFREQTELLRAQEEELRQNMEEMEATQEALRREEKAMDQL